MRRRGILFGFGGLGAVIVVAGLVGAASAGEVAAKPTPAIYWTNYGVSGTGGTIGRAALTGKGAAQNFIRGAIGPVGVAVHGGYVYWSNPGIDANSPGTTIGRATVAGTKVRQKFIGGLNSPHSLAISGNYIYWANFGGIHGTRGSTIGRANLDGTAANQHFITGAKSPVGVTIATR